MPKTKLDRPICSCWEAYRGAVMSRMVEYNLDINGLANLLGVSYPTAKKFIENPGCMTLDRMRKLNRSLDLTADAVRPLLPVR